MTNVVSMKEGAILDPKVIESIVMNGDLSKLQPAQKVAYYNYRCQQAGLDPAAKPFDLAQTQWKGNLICERTMHSAIVCYP
jgi:hypothetical protein